jgi:hypothetical protein
MSMLAWPIRTTPKMAPQASKATARMALAFGAQIDLVAVERKADNAAPKS